MCDQSASSHANSDPNGNDDKMMKPKKFSKYYPIPSFVIETSNKYGILNNEVCKIDSSQIKRNKDRCEIRKRKHYNRKQPQEQKETPSNSSLRKDYQNSMKHFETVNKFMVFEDNSEEDINQIIRKIKIQDTPK